MRLLHTGDWHIGKQLNGFDLLDIQKEVFEQIVTIAKEQKVDGIIIAGDLYDRAIPSVSAIKAFDYMLKVLNLDLNLPIYAISGNHDGANRLNFARDWFGKQDLYLNTNLKEALVPIEVEDVQLFLLPFFDPQDARSYYDVSIESNELRTIKQAMQRVVTDLVAQFDPSKKHVLITHFNVSGVDNVDYELTSETTSTVGGLNTITSDVFKDFDYVALGHLHLWQASPAKNMRYSGSTVKFNTKEAQNEKGVYIVDISTKNELSISFKKLKQTKDLIVLKGTYEELINPSYYENLPKKGQAFFSVQLKNRPDEQNVRHKLEEIYGDVVEIQYHVPVLKNNLLKNKTMTQEKKSDFEIIKQFYEDVMQPDKLSAKQIDFIEETLIKLRKEGEN